MPKAADFAPSIVRWGVGIVFFVFGIWQFVDPTGWFGFLPASIPFGLAPLTTIYLNATVDTILGALLLTGLFTRVVAAIAVIHLAAIISVLGWNDTVVRDIGLLLVLVGVFLHGPDIFCVDTKLRKRAAR